MALPSIDDVLSKKQEKTLPRPNEIVTEYATQLEERNKKIEIGKQSTGPFVQKQTIQPVKPNSMNTQPLSFSQPTLQRSFAQPETVKTPTVQTPAIQSSAKQSKTLSESVSPLSIQNPLKRGGTPVKTKDDLINEYVESRLESDRKGSSSNKILSAINTFLEPLSRKVYQADAYLAPFQKGAGNALGVQTVTAPYEPTVLNKGLEIVGGIAGSVTNPSNLSQGLVSAPYRAGQQLATKAAQVTPKLGNNLTQRAIEGTTAGAIQGGVISGVRGETDVKELARNIGLGAALGGVGDVAISGIGQGARAIIKKYSTPTTQVAQNTLSLPAPKQRGNVNNAVTDDVITNEYTFGLPDANPQTTARISNVSEGRADLRVIDDEIRKLQADYDRAILEEFENLRTSLKNRQGVQQGNIQTNELGEVVGRSGRISNNPRWYQEFYATNNKVPNQRELYALAKKHVDEGFNDDMGAVPGWVEVSGYRESMDALQGVRETLSQSIQELDPSLNVTGLPLRESVLSFDASNKVKRQTSNTDKIAPNFNRQVDTPNVVNKVAPTTELTVPKQVEAPKESWFEKLFGRSGVGIKAGNTNAKELIDTHVTRYGKEQAPVIERVKDAASIAEQDYIDKFAPFKAISNETYDSAMDSTRANNLANVTIKDKFVDLDGNVKGNSLKDVYSLVPRGQKDIADRYLIMRDAVDRMDRGIKVYGDQPWFPKTSQEAAEMVRQLEIKNPWLKNFGEEWNQFNRNRQDLWVESGLVPQDLIDTLRTTNPNYTPMQRQMPNTSLKNVMRGNSKDFSGQKAPIKRAVGSSRKIIEPAQSMINSTANSYHAMMRNRAMQKLYEAVVSDPEKYRGIIEIVDEGDTAKQATLSKINQVINDDGLDGLADMLNNEIDSLFTKAKQASAKPTDNHVTVMINGQPVKMNVQEKSLLRAIEGVSPERLEGILRIADVLSRGVKTAATGALAPLQGTKLFVRDTPIAFAQSKDKVRFLGDISHAMISQIADWLPEFVPGAQNLGKLAREYYRAGGGYEQYLRGDSRIRAAASDITRDPLLSGRNILKQVKKTQLGLRPFKELGDAFENIPRIAAFQAAMRKSGWVRDEATIRNALNEAREATVNWSRKGAKGQQIESVLPYSNAAVQGTYRMAKFLKEQPVSALGLMTAITGATIASYEQLKDDPDYKNRSKYAKGIVVGKRDDGKFITIPVEPTYQYIADQVLNFYKWAKDNEQLPSATESIQEGLDAYTPKYIAGPASLLTAEGNGSNRFQTGVANTLGGSSLEPLVAISTGKNYFGGDIIPKEYQSNSTAFQQNETTSAAANWAAENLGMDAFTFDYLGQKFGGDLAKVLLPMTSDVGKGDPTGNIVDETLARLQLLEDPVMKNNLSNEYYKYANKVTQAKADSSRAETPLPDWYDTVYNQVTSTKKGSVASQISELNKQKKEVQRNLSLTAKQRSEQLRNVQTQINLLRIEGIRIMEQAGVME